MLHAVVMAGGAGTRFWPRSTQSHPKQFLKLFGERTMLQTTVERIERLIPAERVWVITNDRYVDLVQQQLPDVPAGNIVGEAVARNTAPCVALAAALIREQDPGGTMVVLPADHQIDQPERFISILEAAADKAEAGENLVTIGIKPDRPETGYGYVEFEKDTAEERKGWQIKKVRQFREKPGLKTAEEFLSSGNFLWNSGMFIWQASVILKEFKRYLPEVYERVEELEPAIGTDGQKKAVDTFYQNCPSMSIDFGIMEQAQSVFVVPGSFGWNDVGSWRAVYELRTKDSNGNVVQAENTVVADASNNLIQSNGDKMIALVGVENLAVVETDQAILICNMNEAQGVKEVVNRLRENEETEKFL